MKEHPLDKDIVKKILTPDETKGDRPVTPPKSPSPNTQPPRETR